MTRCYAFRYQDGTNTTSGDGATLHIAGQLYLFASPTLRDEWVAEGYSRRSADFRRAVTTRDLPLGWHTVDAVEPEVAT